MTVARLLGSRTCPFTYDPVYCVKSEPYMRREFRRTRNAGRTLLRVAVMLFIISLVSGCGAVPRTASPTPTVPVTPTTQPTSTAQPTPTAHSTPTISPTRMPTPTKPVPTTKPAPTATPSTACIPPRGVQPVSPVLIRNGNTSKMQVSLTFDSDGASADRNAAALQYLDILRSRNLHATFFLTGSFAGAYPDVVRRILAEGHELGNHTMDHADLARPLRTDTFICNELTQAERQIVAAGGRTTRPYFRPPFGSYNDQVRYLAAGQGYRTVYWTVDPRDWETTATADDIVSRVLTSPGLKPGAIILMHFNSPNERYALDRTITGLEQRGYTIVPLSQLLK